MFNHPPSGLRQALRGNADKQQLVDWVFDKVAVRYDLGNDIMSLGWHTRWKHRLINYIDPSPGLKVLDLAAGTGDLSWLLAQRGASVVATDINEKMLELALRKGDGDLDIRFETADAQALPYPNESFDLVTCSYAGRGFPSWERVLSEAHRVLKPGGHFWNLDFARPPNKTWDRTVRAYMTVSGAVLGTVLHGHPKAYVYIPESMRAYKGQRWLKEQIAAAGFQSELIETRGCLMAYNHGIK